MFTQDLALVKDPIGKGFCWIYTLEIAVKGAGTLDGTKIRDYLRSRPFDLPYRKNVKFDSRKLPPPFALTVQTVKGENKLILPKDSAQTKLVYPRTDWGK